MGGGPHPHGQVKGPTTLAPLDVRSAILVLMTTHFVLAVILVLCGRFQKTYDGFQCWVGDAWVTTLGFLALLLDPLNPALAATAANFLLCTGGMLAVDGVLRFGLGRPLPRAWYLAPAVVAVVQGALAATPGGMAVQAVIAAAWIACTNLFNARILLRSAPAEARGLYRTAAGVELAFVALLAFQAVNALLGDLNLGVLEAGTRQALFFIGLCLLDPCLLLVFLLLNSQRLESEILASNLELRTSQARLGAARAEFRLLSGILPICANCKKIRDPQDEWHAVDRYLATHSGAAFDRRICPECS